MKKETNGQQVKDLLALAEHFLTLLSYEDAYYLFQKLRNYPDQVSCHELSQKASCCLYNLGKYKEILIPFSTIDLNEADMDFLNKMAERLEEQGFINEAVEVLRFINQNNALFKEYVEEKRAQTDITLALQQGEYFLRKQQFQEAKRQFQLAIKLGYADYVHILSIYEMKQEFGSKNAHFWLGKGAILLDLKRYLDAAKCFENALNLLGKTARTNILKKLEEIYDKAMKIMPDDSELYYRIALFYFQNMKNYKKANEYFDFLSRDKEYGKRAATYLGIIAYHSRNWEKSLNYFENGRMQKEHFNILYSIGEKFEKENNLYFAYRAYKLIDGIESDYKKISLKIQTLKLKFKSEELEKYNISLSKSKKPITPLQGIAAQRYKYLSTIGSGGMGNVYKVKDQIQKNIVALKLLSPELSQDTDVLKRFFKEAQMASTLNHPYIIEIYDYGFEPRFRQNYITMEYIDGPNLRTLIQKDWEQKDELTNERIQKFVNYIVQLLEALIVTHEKGIIHLDIKPDNILVTKENTIKVTDFGIATLDFGEEPPPGNIIGTLKYMSPEQIAGEKIDQRADIYSTGIVLYEMFSGEPPFIIGDIAYQQLNVAPLSLREIYPLMPIELNSIILKCLKKRPEERFSSAHELLSALISIY